LCRKKDDDYDFYGNKEQKKKKELAYLYRGKVEVRKEISKLQTIAEREPNEIRTLIGDVSF
jgi:hypothetical protein